MPDLNPFAGLANEVTLAAMSGKFVTTAAGVTATTGIAIQGVTGGVPLPISGTINASTTATASASAPTYTAGAQPLSVDLAGNLRTVFSNTTIGISGTLPAFAATPTFNIGTAPTIAVTGTFWQTTQPVSGPLTDAQLRATAVPVSGTVTANAGTGTFAISATALPLPTGAATETTLAALSTKTPALGTAAASASTPVVQANDTVVTTTALSAINTDLITGTVSGWYDAAAFHSVAIQIIGSAGISAGQIIFEQTNDTTAAAAGNVWPVDENTSLTPTPNVAALAIAASAIRMFSGQVVARYVRVRISTAFTGGTVGAVCVFSQQAYVRPIQTIHQATAGNLNATVAGTVTATVGTSITGGTISPLTVAGVTIETSAARTATANGTTITNASAEGAHFFINVSAVSGTTPTLVGQLQYQDPVSTNFVDVPGAATITISTVSTVMLSVIPGISEAANSKVNSKLPRVFRWRWTIGGTTPSFTFSIGAAYVV